ncbi:hypothetical protein GEMRC1_004974 [Eukaryota sp. GEM-RC1]
MLLIQVEGSDTTGKTLHCRRLESQLTSYKKSVKFCPPARDLIPNFMMIFDTLSPAELVIHELRGFAARLDWAVKSKADIVLIDRGLETIKASSVARLVVAGHSDVESKNAVAELTRHCQLGYNVHTLHIILQYPDATAISHFLSRESSSVGKSYLTYQQYFIKILQSWNWSTTIPTCHLDASLPVDLIGKDLLQFIYPFLDLAHDVIQLSDPVIHQAILMKMKEIANDLNAGLWLTGSRFYALHGDDYDIRMIVSDLAECVPVFLSYSNCSWSAYQLCSYITSHGINTLGIKFNWHGVDISVQFMTKQLIEDLCSLSNCSVIVLRTSPTSLHNDVYDIHGREYQSVQPHTKLDENLFRVELKQSYFMDNTVVTQVYHNMIITADILIDRHSLSLFRQQLLSNLLSVAISYSVPVPYALFNWLKRNHEKWTPCAKYTILQELISSNIQKVVLSTTMNVFNQPEMSLHDSTSAII